MAAECTAAFIYIIYYMYLKGVEKMPKIIIESSDKRDTQVDIEEKLEKAVYAIREQREGKQFTDNFLRETKEKADVVVNKLFSNMVKEINEVLAK